MEPNAHVDEKGGARAMPKCTTMGHGGIGAVATVNLYDCDEGGRGECTGHPYCQECVDALVGPADDNVVREWLNPPVPEVPTWWKQLVGDLKLADHLGDARGSVGWAPDHLKSYAYAVFEGSEPNHWSDPDA